MQMWMVDQILAPGVKNGEEADFSTEMFRISSDEPQGFGGGLKEYAVDGSLVLQGDGGNLFRNCKYNVKIRHAKKLGLPSLNPLGPRQRLAFWTVSIRARV